jgi:hypothetical protein
MRIGLFARRALSFGAGCRRRFPLHMAQAAFFAETGADGERTWDLLASHRSAPT